VLKRESNADSRSGERAKNRFAGVVTGGALLGWVVIGWAGYCHFGPATFRQPFFFLMLLVLAALGASFRWRLSRRVNFALTLLSLGTALGLTELGLSLMPAFTGEDPMIKRLERMSRDGITVDQRSQSTVITHLRQRQQDAYPAITGEVLRGGERHGLSLAIRIEGRRAVPLSNVANRRIIDCNESGTWSWFDADDFGFRNPPLLWSTAPLDAVLLGDSFVSGSCVHEGQDMAATIRQSIPATASVAVGGFGPLMALGALSEYIAPHRPKVVVWFYYEGNDMQELLVEAQDPVLRRYLDDPTFSQNLIAQRSGIDAQMRSFLDSLLHRAVSSDANPDAIRLGTWLRMTIKLYRLRTTLGLADWGAGCCDIGLFRQVIMRADETVRGWGGRLLFVYLPSWRGLARPPWLRREAAMRSRDPVLHAMQDLDIPVIDVYPLFRESNRFHAYFAGPDLHFSAAGYARVGEELGRVLSSVLKPPR